MEMVKISPGNFRLPMLGAKRRGRQRLHDSPTPLAVFVGERPGLLSIELWRGPFSGHFPPRRRRQVSSLNFRGGPLPSSVT